jgi:hypothetical protein
MKNKSNKKIKISKDPEKSYIYIDEGNKNIGMLMWHYTKKKWVFDDHQIIKKTR